jgi:flagellar assembly protein FliH
MDEPLIRAAALSPQPRTLSRRGGSLPQGPAPAAAASPVPAAAAAAPVAPAPTHDLQAQRAAWQRQAEQELAAARQRHEQEGWAAGHAKGQAEAEAQQREKLQHLDQLVRNAGRAFTQQIEGLEDIAVGIAFEALSRLLGEALVRREGVQAMVATVLERVQGQERLVVRLAPADFYLLLQHAPGQPALAHPGVELVPDERVALGGCLVETGAGSLDARLETQWGALRDLLLRTRAERGPRGDAA